MFHMHVSGRLAGQETGGFRWQRRGPMGLRGIPGRRTPALDSRSTLILALISALTLALTLSIAHPCAAAPKPAPKPARSTAAPPNETAVSLVPIVLTGEPSPGMSGAVVLQRLGAPLINASGDVACCGIVKQGKEKVECLWVGRPGKLRLAANSEDKEKPYRPNYHFYLADKGYLLFESARNHTMVYGFGPRGLSRCPVGPYGSFGSTNFQATPEGVAIMNGWGATGETRLVCWPAGSEPTTLVRLGDAAPGMPGDGIVIAGFTRDAICAAGVYVMFSAFVKGPGVPRGGMRATWLSGPSGISLVTPDGHPPRDPSPQWAPSVWPLDVDATGRIAIRVEPVSGASQVWIGTNGSMKPIADAAMGTPVWLLDDGRALYLSNENGLVAGNGIDKSATLIPAGIPGAGGESIMNIATSMSVSPAGNLAWVGADGQGTESLFVYADGKVRTLLSAGQSVQVGPDDRRIISGTRGICLANDLLPTSPSPGGWRTFSSINDSGAVVVTLQFDAQLGVRDPSEGVFLLQVR